MKDEVCVVGLDPDECGYGRSCRYWDWGAGKCSYSAIKAAERKKRREAEFDAIESGSRRRILR